MCRYSFHKTPEEQGRPAERPPVVHEEEDDHHGNIEENPLDRRDHYAAPARANLDRVDAKNGAASGDEYGIDRPEPEHPQPAPARLPQPQQAPTFNFGASSGQAARNPQPANPFAALQRQAAPRDLMDVD